MNVAEYATNRTMAVACVTKPVRREELQRNVPLVSAMNVAILGVN
jgi:hypothetical protein